MSKRILLKISGEIFMNANGESFDFAKYGEVARVLVDFVANYDLELAVVLGAGNIWRYRDTKDANLDRVVADQLGMTATCFNAKILERAINNAGGNAVSLTDFHVPGLMPAYSKPEADRLLREKKICILAGGTGKPFFTTDSCAVLRSLELGCEMFFKATKVDGVYDSDPKTNSEAKRFDKISYDEVLARSLEVMDLTAISLAKDAKLPMLVFDFNDYSNLEKAFNDNSLGTLVN